jgi:IS30 family transposase
VPALNRLAVREISGRFLSQDERIEIAGLHQAGLSIRQVAARLGRAPSRVSRELRRNATAAGCRPFEAHRRAVARRARHHRRIGTLVERQTRMVRLLHMPRRDGQALHDALKARMADLPPLLLRSITWDQGTDMARHLTITRSLGVPVCFCDPHSPWQRGSNENMNGLLRDYFPKGTDLSVHPPHHLLAVESELNSRPRRILSDRAPAELFALLLASESPPVLQR